MTESERLIDDYLTRLLRELRLGPAMTRRVLAETEDHLREAVERERAAGREDEAAARRAIARFGSPRLVARRFAAEQGIRLLPPSVILHLVLALGLLAGVGMAAIGVSGLLAAGMGGLFGKEFVAGDAPGVTYTAERCAEFLKYYPAGRDCAAAALDDHFDEVVGFRVAAGVLGLLALGGYLLVRRRYRHLAGVRVLPDGFTATVGAALFGVAALGLLANSSMQILFGGMGSTGNMLSGGIVALVVFALFARSLLGTLSVYGIDGYGA